MRFLSKQRSSLASLWAEAMGELTTTDPRRVREAALTIRKPLVRSSLHHGVKRHTAVPELPRSNLLVAKSSSDVTRASTTAEEPPQCCWHRKPIQISCGNFRLTNHDSQLTGVN